ncbi:uncharacterized protein PODANS_2_11340 [Podospora anserina S mat+]|uniref:Podospora anserina S mat+ genomic DNA chromosome 2, supercontig 2 n=1 Tax=Podospora anserina (strain S / ATCC MYA-4624 / DSM 980 / FGSC 10383) TaxID=515849 RepID=B2B7J6_PODAN|nr:uncharacterized protein PODANS_2_11340 [Podospora anserina S mat+]CAP73774.1 unnamed protein product [Podospora anserina S mat+]CDP26175.1 Putative protein of unknown function [Podospora anserina S mat+]
MAGFDGTAFFALFLGFFFPPLGVALLTGCGTDVCINLCLLIFGVIPAYLHLWYLVYVYLDNKKLLKPIDGGRPFVFSDKLQRISTRNRSTASLPTPRTSTKEVQPHRSNPAVQEKPAQEQKPAAEQTSTPSAISTPVSTSGPSTKPAQKTTTQAAASEPTPAMSPLPLLDKNDGASPQAKA